MAKSLPRAIVEDFNGVLEFLSSKKILSNPLSAEARALAKKLHLATYSLILWRFRLRNLPPHGKVFLEEIASDAVQILPQAIAGYNKTTQLLTRSVLENFLRHVYFSDHPVEFQKMHGDKKWYVTVAELREYASSHPMFVQTEGKFDAVQRISNLYSELSQTVHGSRVQDLEMKTALNKLNMDLATLKSIVRYVEKSAESVNFLLGVFHKKRFTSLQQEDRRIVLRTMSSLARRTLHELE